MYVPYSVGEALDVPIDEHRAQQDGRLGLVKHRRKFTLSKKQISVLELAYGTECPDFSKPILVNECEIAMKTGLCVTYVN